MEQMTMDLESNTEDGQPSPTVRCLTDKDLYWLAKKLGKDWTELAILLGFKKPDIERLEMDHPNNSLKCIHNMLVCFRNKHSAGSFYQICDALTQCGYDGLRRELNPSKSIMAETPENTPGQSFGPPVVRTTTHAMCETQSQKQYNINIAQLNVTEMSNHENNTLHQQCQSVPSIENIAELSEHFPGTGEGSFGNGEDEEMVNTERCHRNVCLLPSKTCQRRRNISQRNSRSRSRSKQRRETDVIPNANYNFMKEDIADQITDCDLAKMKRITSKDIEKHGVGFDDLATVSTVHAFFTCLERNNMMGEDNLYFIMFVLHKMKKRSAIKVVDEYAKTRSTKPLVLKRVQKRKTGKGQQQVEFRITGHFKHAKMKSASQFKKTLSERLGITRRHINLVGAGKGSIILVFQMPSKGIDLVRQAVAERHSWLRESGVLNVHIEGEDCVRIQEEFSILPNLQTSEHPISEIEIHRMDNTRKSESSLKRKNSSTAAEDTNMDSTTISQKRLLVEDIIDSDVRTDGGAKWKGDGDTNQGLNDSKTFLGMDLGIGESTIERLNQIKPPNEEKQEDLGSEDDQAQMKTLPVNERDQDNTYIDSSRDLGSEQKLVGDKNQDQTDDKSFLGIDLALNQSAIERSNQLKPPDEERPMCLGFNQNGPAKMRTYDETDQDNTYIDSSRDLGSEQKLVGDKNQDQTEAIKFFLGDNKVDRYISTAEFLTPIINTLICKKDENVIFDMLVSLRDRQPSGRNLRKVVRDALIKAGRQDLAEMIYQEPATDISHYCVGTAKLEIHIRTRPPLTNFTTETLSEKNGLVIRICPKIPLSSSRMQHQIRNMEPVLEDLDTCESFIDELEEGELEEEENYDNDNDTVFGNTTSMPSLLQSLQTIPTTRASSTPIAIPTSNPSHHSSPPTNHRSLSSGSGMTPPHHNIYGVLPWALCEPNSPTSLSSGYGSSPRLLTASTYIEEHLHIFKGDPIGGQHSNQPIRGQLNIISHSNGCSHSKPGHTIYTPYSTSLDVSKARKNKKKVAVSETFLDFSKLLPTEDRTEGFHSYQPSRDYEHPDISSQSTPDCRTSSDFLLDYDNMRKLFEELGYVIYVRKADDAASLNVSEMMVRAIEVLYARRSEKKDTTCRRKLFEALEQCGYMSAMKSLLDKGGDTRLQDTAKVMSPKRPLHDR